MAQITISNELFEKVKKSAEPETLEILSKFTLDNIKQKNIDEYNKLRAIEQQRTLQQKKEEEERRQQKELAKKLRQKRKLEKKQKANAEQQISWRKQRRERLKQTKELLAKREQARMAQKRKRAKASGPKHMIGDPAPVNPFPKTQRYSQPPVPMAITSDHKGPIKPRAVATRSSSRERANFEKDLDAYDSYVAGIAHHSESFGYGRKKSLEYTGWAAQGRACGKKRKRNKKGRYDPNYPDRWAIK